MELGGRDGRSLTCGGQTPPTSVTHLDGDDVGPGCVGHGHPVGQVHAAVAVGSQEGVWLWQRQRAGALPPLGGVLWRLHKRDWDGRKKEEVRGGERELLF